MIPLKSKVGDWQFQWKTIPKGIEGVAVVDVQQSADAVPMTIEIRWKRDTHGIWIEFPKGMVGFDLNIQKESGEPNTYHLFRRIQCGEWSGVVPLRGNAGAQQSGRSQRTGMQRIRSQMPGKIIRILVKPDQIVKKDQPLLVMEAMKMENEIRAPVAGRITEVKVVENSIVETGIDLLLVEAQEVAGS